MGQIADGYHALAPGKVASVVTYVEMTERPAWIDGEFAGGLERFDVADLDGYRRLFRSVGEHWLWFSRLRLSEEELRGRLGKPGYEVYRYAPAGGIVELDRSKSDNVEIVLFGLPAGESGQGQGRAMMAHALRVCWEAPAKRVWLHTCTLDDPRALGFYRKMGFRAYARGIEIADDPRLQGFLPETAAPQVPIIR